MKPETHPHLNKIKESLKNMMSTIITSGIILCVESFVICLAWNYVFPEQPLTYIKALLLLFIVRLTFRTLSIEKNQ